MTDPVEAALRWAGPEGAFCIDFHADGTYTWSGSAGGIKVHGMRLRAGVMHRHRRAIYTAHATPGESVIAPPWVWGAAELLLLEWAVGDDHLSIEFSGDMTYTWRATAGENTAEGRVFTAQDAARYDHLLRPPVAGANEAVVPKQLQLEIERMRSAAGGPAAEVAAHAAGYLEGLLYAARCNPSAGAVARTAISMEATQ